MLYFGSSDKGANMKTTCPLCKGKALKPIYEVKDFPLFVCKTYKSKEEAKGVRVADIYLVHCQECDFVFNATEKAEVVKWLTDVNFERIYNTFILNRLKFRNKNIYYGYDHILVKKRKYTSYKNVLFNGNQIIYGGEIESGYNFITTNNQGFNIYVYLNSSILDQPLKVGKWENYKSIYNNRLLRDFEIKKSDNKKCITSSQWDNLIKHLPQAWSDYNGNINAKYLKNTDDLNDFEIFNINDGQVKILGHLLYIRQNESSDIYIITKDSIFETFSINLNFNKDNIFEGIKTKNIIPFNHNQYILGNTDKQFLKAYIKEIIAEELTANNLQTNKINNIAITDSLLHLSATFIKDSKRYYHTDGRKEYDFNFLGLRIKVIYDSNLDYGERNTYRNFHWAFPNTCIGAVIGRNDVYTNDGLLSVHSWSKTRYKAWSYQNNVKCTMIFIGY